jgi:translocation and assembly module TamB
MVRRTGYILLALALLCSLVIGSVCWLLLTTGGAQFLFRQLPGRAGVALEAEVTAGSLARGLRIDNLVLEYQGHRVTLSAADYRLSLDRIYPLNMTVDSLSVHGLRVDMAAAADAAKDPSASGPVALPRLQSLFDHLQLRVNRFELKDAVLRQHGEVRLAIDRLVGSLDLVQRQLTLDLELLHSADLQAAGVLVLDLALPSLSVSGSLSTSDTALFWRRVDLSGTLTEPAFAQLAGTLEVRADLHDVDPLQLSAGVTIKNDQLDIHALSLRQEGRNGLVEASGSLSLTDALPQLDADIRVTDLDLEPEAGLPLLVGGDLALRYADGHYRGQFSVNSSGAPLTAATLDGSLSGDHDQIRLNNLVGQWSAGQVTGSISGRWNPSLEVQGDLAVTGLQADAFLPQLDLHANGRLSGSFAVTDQRRLASLAVDLDESFVAGLPLSGSARLQLHDQQLIIDDLSLESRDNSLSARGDSLERIDFRLKLTELAELYPAAGGALGAEGWFGFADLVPQGAIQLQGRGLHYEQWQLDELQADVAMDKEQRGAIEISGAGLRQATETPLVEDFTLTGAGTLAEHRLQLRVASELGTLTTGLAGGWAQSSWQGLLTELTLVDGILGPWQLEQEAELLLSAAGDSSTAFMLAGGTGQKVAFAGTYASVTGDFLMDLNWDNLSLEPLTDRFADQPLRGESSGHLVLVQQQGVREVTAQLRLSAVVEHEKIHLDQVLTELSLVWNARGLTSDVTLDIGAGAGFSAHFSTTEPFALAPPQELAWRLRCQDIPVSVASFWLPDDILLDGSLVCESQGTWSLQQPFALSGSIALNDGVAGWYDVDQSIEVELESATLTWNWQESLFAELLLRHDYGYLNGSLRLPLRAQWPLQLVEDLPVTANLALRFAENGLISTLFPLQVQGSRGLLDLRVTAGGTMKNPELSGRFDISDAELYLPAAAIRLDDVALSGRLEDERLVIEDLRLTSGQGTLAGTGGMQLDNWMPQNFHLSLQGSRFQLLNLPALQVRISPDLQLEGTMDQLKVRGVVEIPDVMVRDQTRSTVITNSPDLIVLDRQLPQPREQRIRHDLDIKLILGDQVLVDAVGLEARLEGELRLYSDLHQTLAAQGRLQVVRGRFSSYGVNLDIERGDLLYSGGPLPQPTFDVLALRRVGLVKAGVRLSGTPQEPVVQLYSDPAMQDEDVLAYIVFGRPLGAPGEDRDLLMTAAAALLSQGESVVLQEKMKGHLGLDVLEFSAGEGDVQDSVLTTGKYLTPELYVSFGYSLFNESNEIKVRYRLTSALELESSFGLESGVDLFYRFEIE